MSELSTILNSLTSKQGELADLRNLETLLNDEEITGANLTQVTDKIATLESEISTLETQRDALE
jgi:predicted  nucleic acid-binding Zn-ribbon protein